MAFGLETGPDTVVNIKVIGVGGRRLISRELLAEWVKQQAGGSGK